jgi:hypothetical protein
MLPCPSLIITLLYGLRQFVLFSVLVLLLSSASSSSLCRCQSREERKKSAKYHPSKTIEQRDARNDQHRTIAQSIRLLKRFHVINQMPICKLKLITIHHHSLALSSLSGFGFGFGFIVCLLFNPCSFQAAPSCECQQPPQSF